MEELRSEMEQLKEGQILCVLNLDAHSIILMHNHPSGSVKPFSDTKIAAEEKNVKEETAEYIIPKKKKSKQRGR